ncbi:NAD(P)H:quinone oxidoreductase [Roseomonas sp. CCTCC AB2023176]|uniref:NAD(P)H:quinone oxidoreductase n=1 Tax=Roseomonas sp. CCTCC AB2023176 TaxID=3342640 RepID=UPI0035D7BF53
MAKVLVLYYSSYGHVETLANAVAEGARSVPGTVADVKRVPELVPAEVAEKSHYKINQAAAVAQVDDLKGYDAIIIGSPTRFGNMASQMKNFLDQAGGLWATDALVGKVGSAFTSTATPHGGQESTLLTIHNVLLHFGLVIVGLPYSYKGQMDPSVVQGGTPYGASTVAGGMGQLQPTPGDLEGARFQGAHVAKIAAKLAA